MPSQEFTTDELTNEIWRPVIGYETYYSVSNLGRVKRTAGGKGIVKGKILKNRPSKGYARVSLCVNGRAKDFDTHILVASAFIGPRPKGHEVNHKDRIRSNARLSNLEYVTPIQNIHHSLPFVRAQRLQTRGIHHWATITSDQAAEVLRLHSIGYSRNRIAGSLSLGVSAVRSIVNGHSWKKLAKQLRETAPSDS